jgi:hypothetical protein
VALTAEETRGEKMHAWIVAALERNATVTVANYLHAWKLTRKHLGMIRLRKTCEEFEHPEGNHPLNKMGAAMHHGREALRNFGLL